MLGKAGINLRVFAALFLSLIHPPTTIVIPAKAGTQCSWEQRAVRVPTYRRWMDRHAPLLRPPSEPWVPAFAGMTAGGWDGGVGGWGELGPCLRGDDGRRGSCVGGCAELGPSFRWDDSWGEERWYRLFPPPRECVGMG
jgi:hypothetical protein